MKRSPIKRVNAKRRAKRRAECFGPQAEACRWMMCCIRWDRMSMCGPSDPHHEPTRAAGGKDCDTVPLCRRHHDERHRIGRETFWSKYGVDPEEVKAEMRRRVG